MSNKTSKVSQMWPKTCWKENLVLKMCFKIKAEKWLGTQEKNHKTNNRSIKTDLKIYRMGLKMYEGIYITLHK